MNKVWIWMGALLLTLAAAGCAGGGKAQVAVNMREFGFSPDSLSVPAGAELTLTVKNLGALEHNLHIMDLGNEIRDSWSAGDEDAAVLNFGVVDGGDTRSLTFTAPNAPGDYQFLCSVPSHFELGMHGTITVVAP